ncbi:HAD domain-containing protein [Roseateles sp.]|uniref:HAD domain-containing protein n=1 Tax=Roseateles sp. TaxID=1971397 RepID=UPI0039EAE844
MHEHSSFLRLPQWHVAALPMTFHRALFIDFDGVLHRAGDGIEDVGPHWVWLPLLAKALELAPDLPVVVHSTWRYQYHPSELRELLSPLGSRLIDVAPRGPRQEAIRWWLHMHPTVTSYRVLDDDGKEFDEPHPEELLLCEPSLGLTTPGVLERLVEWLEKSTS